MLIAVVDGLVTSAGIRLAMWSSGWVPTVFFAYTLGRRRITLQMALAFTATEAIVLTMLMKLG